MHKFTKKLFSLISIGVLFIVATGCYNVTGTITIGGTSLGVEGATVHSYYENGNPINTFISDSNGNISASQVPSDCYYLNVTHDGMTFEPSGNTQDGGDYTGFACVAGDDLADVNFEATIVEDQYEPDYDGGMPAIISPGEIQYHTIHEYNKICFFPSQSCTIYYWMSDPDMVVLGEDFEYGMTINVKIYEANVPADITVVVYDEAFNTVVQSDDGDYPEVEFTYGANPPYYIMIFSTYSVETEYGDYRIEVNQY